MKLTSKQWADVLYREPFSMSGEDFRELYAYVRMHCGNQYISASWLSMLPETRQAEAYRQIMARIRRNGRR